MAPPTKVQLEFLQGLGTDEMAVSALLALVAERAVAKPSAQFILLSTQRSRRKRCQRFSKAAVLRQIRLRVESAAAWLRREGHIETPMQRITITIDDDLLTAIDALCGSRGYASRSEAVRDIVRDALAPSQVDQHRSAPCYGALSYVYSHGTRDLARRLTSVGHDHGIAIASLHVHLDRDDCLEVAVLRGAVGDMQAYADAVTTQRGVRYGHLHLIPDTHGPAADHVHDHRPTHD